MTRIKLFLREGKLNKNKSFDHQVIEGLDKRANLFSFEEDSEVMKEEMMEAGGDKRDKVALTVQMSISSSDFNKRTFSETGCMDIDEETSSKKIKMQPQNELINSEEVISEDLKKMVLFQKKSVQMQQYSFEDEGKIESSSQYKSKTVLMSSYADKEMHSLDETKNLLPRVRKLIKKLHRFLLGM